jgi:VIT1/CCC1 family predicted Fe2+/Mn2+ transporter
MGAIAAKAGGANIIRGSLRVAFWGAAAMSFTGLIGLLFEKFQ